MDCQADCGTPYEHPSFLSQWLRLNPHILLSYIHYVNDDTYVTLNQSRPPELSEARDREAERLRLSFLRGTRRLPSRSLEREDSEPELELESESDTLESDADSDSEPDDDSESDERLDLRKYVD